jgi:hypothetical protein
MSTAIPHSSLAFPQDRSATSTAGDLPGGDDLYTAWKSIFERVHAVEELSDSPSESDKDAHDFRGLGGKPAVSEAAANNSSAALDAVVHDASATSVYATGLSEANAAVGEEVKTNRVMAASAVPDLAMSFGASNDCEADLVTTRCAVTQATCDSFPPDVVTIYQASGQVAVVVRDATLTDDDALSSAFAAAATLTGSRAALGRLTLNGRILYQHPAIPDRGTSSPDPGMAAFTC